MEKGLRCLLKELGLLRLLEWKAVVSKTIFAFYKDLGSVVWQMKSKGAELVVERFSKR